MPGTLETHPSDAGTNSGSRGGPGGRFLLEVWRASRPSLWVVTLLPYYIGHLLATRELIPGFALWAAFWGRAAYEGTTIADFRDTMLATVFGNLGFLAGLLVMGPLVWAATLLLNDAYDVAGDRANPRKADAPVVSGRLSVQGAKGLAGLFAALALVFAAGVHIRFLAVVGAVLALSWAYSAPPFRLKTRPGADVVVNALGVGLLSAVAGWAVTMPVIEFPYWLVLQGVLVAVGVYVPSTLVDHEADRAAGYHTLATHLGPRSAYRVGWWSWVAANVNAVVLSWLDWLLPRAMLPVLLIFVPLLLYEYHRLIGRARTPEARVEGIVVTSLTFLAVNAVFALIYTGMWVR